MAEGLCRLFTGHNVPIYLIDPDRVEEHNLLRQNFYPGEVGKFKSQALAERLSRQYGRPIRYSVYPYDNELVGNEFGSHMVRRMAQGIIVGCVDNAAARQAIAQGFQYSNWWIDAGNGRSSGQVLIGNTPTLDILGGSFNEAEHEVERLPLPSLQVPSLLISTPAPRRDCAQAVAADEQDPVINQAMAALVLKFVHKFLTKSLAWMGAYIDLDALTLQPVPAEPQIVARMMGIKVDILMANRCPIGNRYSLRRR